MSSDGEVTTPHEVVIVRRRGGEGDDGHHGGAWKIAFADLMTAMMAFFLVMWLLNVSDKEKIQQIATYFNPLKLNSKRPTVKGVEEENETPKAAKKSDGPVDGAEPSDIDSDGKRHGFSKRGGDGDLPEGVEKTAEEELFNDPYGVLSRLATQAETSMSQQPDAPTSDSALPGGDSYSNPFEPFADQKVAQPKTAQSDHEQMTLDEPGAHPQPPAIEKPLEIKPDTAADVPPAVAEVKPGPTEKPNEAAQTEKGDKEIQNLEGELAKALAAISPDKKPNIEVKRVSEGVLISLTDDFRFGMFDLSSAEPRPETVVVMDKIAKVLASHEGKIVVRGHTDARPFKSERNNNWRLSMSRAQMAYYMLTRGGIDEKRFDSIEGRADRDLKMPADPNAAENRRIEIMLRPKP